MALGVAEARPSLEQVDGQPGLGAGRLPGCRDDPAIGGGIEPETAAADLQARDARLQQRLDLRDVGSRIILRDQCAVGGDLLAQLAPEQLMDRRAMAPTCDVTHNAISIALIACITAPRRPI